MFYSYEILQRRNGKFGVIWLAATNPRILNRRDFSCVTLWKSCTEVAKHISSEGRGVAEDLRLPRLSLYLSSQLIYGISYVFRKQSMYLLEDIRILWERVSSLRVIEFAENIDMFPTKRMPVQFDDADLFQADINFGYMKDLDSPLSLPQLNYFNVPSPHSSEEMIRSPQHREGVLEGVEREIFVSPARDITLVEPLPPVRIATEEERMIIGETDIPPLDIEDFEYPFPTLSDPNLTTPFPAPFPEMVPAISGFPEMPPGVEETPAVTAIAPEPKRPQKPSVMSQDLGITLGADAMELGPSDSQALPAARRKRRIEVNGFELDTILEFQPRRPRRRRFQIDTEMSISREDIRTQILTSNQRLTIPLDLPSTTPSVNVLFSQPGSRINSNILKKPWLKLKTHSVPNDPAPPGSYVLQEEELSSASVTTAAEVSATEAPLIEDGADMGFDPDFQRRMDISEEIEIPREVTMPGESAQASLASLRDVSIPALEITRNIPSAPSSFVEMPLEPMLPILEEAEPMETFDEPELLIEPRKECMVSPIYTPPPLSPASAPPVSPSCEKVVEMLANTFDVSPTPGKTTFRALVPPESQNRMYAAQTFSHLLSLHQLKAVSLKQAEPYGEISIVLGENF